MNVIVCNFQNQDVFRHRFYPYSPKELDNITRLNDRLFCIDSHIKRILSWNETVNYQSFTCSVILTFCTFYSLIPFIYLFVLFLYYFKYYLFTCFEKSSVLQLSIHRSFIILYYPPSSRRKLIRILNWRYYKCIVRIVIFLFIIDINTYFYLQLKLDTDKFKFDQIVMNIEWKMPLF